MIRDEVIKLLKSQKHKDGVNPDDWDIVKANLLLLAEFAVIWCKAKGLPLVFTSIIRPMLGISKTDIHSEGRAFDISARGWSDDLIHCFVDEINEKFSIGAISKKDLKEREAVFEEDEFVEKNGKLVQVKWRHIHGQVRG